MVIEFKLFSSLNKKEKKERALTPENMWQLFSALHVLIFSAAGRF